VSLTMRVIKRRCASISTRSPAEPRWWRAGASDPLSPAAPPRAAQRDRRVVTSARA
jgi:hypothetical protein